MMTFLPFEIFYKTEEKDNKGGIIYDYDEIKLKEFYLNNAIPIDYNTGEPSSEETAIIKAPLTQFRLGIGFDLMGDKVNKKYSEIPQLWGIYINILDIYKSCGKFTNYSIYLNLLQMYMDIIREDAVFPTTFSLRKEHRKDTQGHNINVNIWDEETNTYDFRFKYPITRQNLFSRNIKFLGVHFIKYIKDNGNLSVHPLFVFLNQKYEDEIIKPRNNTKTTQGNDFISSYSGQENQIIICDSKMYFIEDGEITPSMSLTYHELTNLLYYGSKLYIIDDNKTELYITMLPRENEELQKLIEVLNMTEVFICKGKITSEFIRDRLVVLTSEEAQKYIKEGKGILMGNQKLPFTSLSGGYKKSRKNIKQKSKKVKRF
jgi:hypothetical protein